MSPAKLMTVYVRPNRYVEIDGHTFGPGDEITVDPDHAKLLVADGWAGARLDAEPSSPPGE